MTLPVAHKVIHVTECLAAGTLAFLVQATRELARAGAYQVVVFSRRPDTPERVELLFDPRVELVEMETPSVGYLRYAMALRRVILRELQGLEEAAVHFHSSKAGFVGRLVLRGLRLRPAVYYSPHGLAFLDSSRKLSSFVFRALEWLAARTDCQSVGCSRSEAKLLDSLHPRYPAVVLENAVDDHWFGLQRQQDLKLPLVISVGRACRQKAPEVFAAMATRFQIAEVPARFVWVGAGDADAEAQLRAAGVEVTGWLDREGVSRLVSQATVYVQTSRWEGMPLSVLQALAAGVPCVVSNAVGNRDAVRQGWTGFVYSRFDEGLVCLRRLLLDKELNRRFSAAARGDAQQRFSSGSFRARLVGLYKLHARVAANWVASPLQPLPAPLPVPADVVEDVAEDVAPLALAGLPVEETPVRKEKVVLRQVVNG